MPNTIAENLQRLIDAKEDIADAITAKGGTVGANDGLEDFASDIATIPSGGGSELLSSLIDRSITSCNVPNGVTTIGSYSFYRCVNLANITIPNTVETIATYAFYMCNSLERVDLSSVTSISTSAFESCASLSTVILGNNLTTISSKAFKATPIKSITIPSSVTGIASNAFSDTYDITITVNKAEGSLSGAPWGASRATVIWNG